MKANEFVKKYGWEYAKHILTDDAPLVMDLNYTDLKRLVESHELVEKLGGMEKCKMLIADYGNSESAAHLSCHVENVESCYVD